MSYTISEPHAHQVPRGVKKVNAALYESIVRGWNAAFITSPDKFSGHEGGGGTLNS